MVKLGCSAYIIAAREHVAPGLRTGQTDGNLLALGAGWCHAVKSQVTKPATVPPSRIPLQVSSVDIRNLPIGPEEAFVWSRVDGQAGHSEISTATGLEMAQVDAALEQLRKLGAVRYDGDSTLPPPRPRSSALAEAQAEPAASAPSRAPENPLGAERERRISEMLVAIDEQDHYQLLGVERSAEKATIKAAYFALIGHFHPDKYYGQDLGENKTKLERVFKKLTEAHDTLTRKRSRATYDASLPPERPRAPSETPAAISAPAPPKNSARPSRSTLKSPVNVASNTAVGDAGAPERPRRPGSSQSTLSAGPETRRRALARKLRASSPPPGTSGARPAESMNRPPVSHPTASSGRLPSVNLRGLRPPSAVQRYLASAAEAEAEGNLVGMANSLRLAVAVKPDDPALSQRLRAAEMQSDVQLADEHLAKARSAETNRDFAEAGRLYARAARGKQSASLFGQAAECCLKGENELRRAGEYAKQAVALEPENADLRLMLGRIYARAGMSASALTELDKASQLSPGDDTIKAWLKRVKTGDV